MLLHSNQLANHDCSRRKLQMNLTNICECLLHFKQRTANLININPNTIFLKKIAEKEEIHLIDNFKLKKNPLIVLTLGHYFKIL